MSWTGRAKLGALVWIGYLYATDQGDTGGAVGALVLGAALVVVPLALRMVQPDAEYGRWTVARVLALPCALLLGGSFLCEPGALAGALSVPWLAFTVLVATLGLLSFIERGGGPVHAVAEDAGLVFLAVGGMWTVASRFGMPVMGFAEPWVILTAAHFHFAGLVLPVVTGRVAVLAGGDLGKLAATGVITGVPLVAVGITAGARGMPTVEWLAALWLMMAAMLTAGLLVMAAVRVKGQPRLLLTLAGLSLLGAMGLVGVYATGAWTGNAWLNIPTMVLAHGLLNAFGFAVPALVALGAVTGPLAPTGMEVLLPWLGDRPAPGFWEARALGEGWQAGAVEDLHRRALPDEVPGNPVANGPFRRAAAAIMGYQVFPPGMLRGVVFRSPVQVGDTLRAVYRFLPGIHMVFAARVVAVFDEARDGVHRTGFVYRTLAGHPIGGEEVFAVEKDVATGAVAVRIASRSRMSTVLTRVLRPLVRWLQRRGGRAGVEYLAQRADRSTQTSS